MCNWWHLKRAQLSFQVSFGGYNKRQKKSNFESWNWFTGDLVALSSRSTSFGSEKHRITEFQKYVEEDTELHLMVTRNLSPTNSLIDYEFFHRHIERWGQNPQYPPSFSKMNWTLLLWWINKLKHETFRAFKKC